MSLARSIAITLAEYRTIYQGDTRLSASEEHRFEQTVATMNSWNIRPIIVLTPVHPAFARAIGPLGWSVRHRQLVAYLRSLRTRLSFDLLDASNIRTFGGTAHGFYDGVHMKVTNVDRLLDGSSARQGEISGARAEANRCCSRHTSSCSASCRSRCSASGRSARRSCGSPFSAGLVRLLCVVGLALPAVDARLDHDRLRRRAADRAYRRPTCPPRAARRGALDQPRRCSRSSSMRDSSSIRAMASRALVGVGQPFPRARARPADRHLVLHVQLDVVHDRRLSRRDPRRRRNPLRYATFVALFPHLIAGPIVRYATSPTSSRGSRRGSRPSWPRAGSSSSRCGFVKKLLIADQLAPTVDRAVRAATRTLGWSAAWAGGARLRPADLLRLLRLLATWPSGSRCLLGIRFPQNFDSPYRAREHRRLLAALAHLALDAGCATTSSSRSAASAAARARRPQPR